MLSVLCIPSSCGMFVYRDDTSMDANKQLVGSGDDSIRFMNSVESLCIVLRMVGAKCLRILKSVL